uniref:Uncharacterized protein n=1 Tax=Leptobrachium leishanense TaxID=445787 RepID=A0A8C5M903_9ANUR
MNSFNTYIDLQKFKRSLCLKKFFAKTPIERIIIEEGKYKHTTLKKKSKFYPRHMISKEMEAFDLMILSEIRKEEKKNKLLRRSNITKEETRALNSLCKNKELIIKPADKGGGVVVLSKDKYEREALRLLGDTTTYKYLEGDPTTSITTKFSIYLDKGKELDILTENEFEYLLVQHPKVPVFYYLPKVHKDRENPPGRPIVSGIGSISSNLSEYLDHLLQPLVVSTRAYVKDTMAIINTLANITWEDTFQLVTCDVNSLYTIIPHHLGCEAVQFFLRELGQFEEEQIDFIIEGIKLILQNNYFWYDYGFYLQLIGTAMGTRFAPSYANLFMAYWEHQMVWTGHCWGQNLILYRRYID